MATVDGSVTLKTRLSRAAMVEGEKKEPSRYSQQEAEKACGTLRRLAQRSAVSKQSNGGNRNEKKAKQRKAVGKCLAGSRKQQNADICQWRKQQQCPAEKKTYHHEDNIWLDGGNEAFARDIRRQRQVGSDLDRGRSDVSSRRRVGDHQLNGERIIGRDGRGSSMRRSREAAS